MINDSASTPHRHRWLGYYSMVLGIGGLAGAWGTAAAFGAPTLVALVLDILCLVAWLVVTAMYFRHGAIRRNGFSTDLRHTEQGFATAYIPVIPLVLLAHAAPHFQAGRYLDLAVMSAWALVTAALVAHWITTPRELASIHPGFSMPVVAGPFIAGISLQTYGWHQLAEGMFVLGAFFWLMFATLITHRLMIGVPLSDRRFPTLAVLMVPPATGSIAWFTLHGNRITELAIGLATVLAMMALIQLFIVPEYVRRGFTMSAWVFSFPVAASANTVAHWRLAAPTPLSAILAWTALVVATAVIGLLAVLTVSRALSARRIATFETRNRTEPLSASLRSPV
jgi:tellurite resistance protein